MATGRPSSAAVERTRSTVSACCSCVPWEKLSRATFNPASMRLLSVSRDAVDGPSVQTILVRGKGTGKGSGVSEAGRFAGGGAAPPRDAPPGESAVGHHVASQCRALLLEPRRERLEALLKAREPVTQQLVGDLAEVDADGCEIGDGALGGGELRVDRARDLPVIAEGVDRGRWHGVHRVGPDQLLDVHDVPIGGILRARAGPKRALETRAGRLEWRPTRRRELLTKELVRQLRVGDGRLAAQSEDGI